MAKIGRLLKEMMVQEMHQNLDENPNFLVASLERLSAMEADALRKRLRGIKAKVRMVKRRIGIRGISDRKLENTRSLFEGSIAVVIPGEDIVPVAKLLFDFAKSSENRLSVRGAWVEGQLLDVKRAHELANLPSRPQLIAQLIGVLESPVSELVMVVEGLLGEVAWIAEEASKTRPSQKPEEKQETHEAQEKQETQESQMPQPQAESVAEENPQKEGS